jgi:hypothetical protein
MAITCSALAPVWLCANADVLQYLAPSAALALLIRALSRRYAVFHVFTLAGTICHELAHLLAGLLTGARPASFTVIPRRSGRGWELGSVVLTRVRWYNAAPAALAPLLILGIPLAVALWRTAPGWRFEPADLGLAFLLAPQMLSFWPSAVDWKIAARSWPMLVLLASGLALMWA